MDDPTFVLPVEDRHCSVCGERLIRSNKVGICRKTEECRRARTKAFRDLKPRSGVPERLKVCSVDGCDEKHKAYGLCVKHAARFKRTGDTGPAESLRKTRTVNAGDTFGKWTVLEPSNRAGERVACRCECGTERRVQMGTLLDGRSKSCGCWWVDPADIAEGARIYIKAGEVYERLTVLEDVTYSTDRAKCRCICGTLKDVKAINLRTSQVRSCGCLRRDTHTVHGMSGDPLYKAWYGMIERCTNPRNASWEHYGGRGIKVCERWLGSPEGLYKFVADLGQRPTPLHSLDRIDVNGNYEPGNVRWATPAQQGDNKRKITVLTRQVGELQAQIARMEAARRRMPTPAVAQDALF